MIKVASILSETVRGADRVARFGGDEFMVLLEETEREETDYAAFINHVDDRTHQDKKRRKAKRP